MSSLDVFALTKHKEQITRLQKLIPFFLQNNVALQLIGKILINFELGIQFVICYDTN